MKVSVIVPCFNAEAFLGQTLNSLLNQTLAPQEIIVVDNGSSDGSLRVAEEFGDAVATIVAREKGASAARNAGIAAASGDALMFLDADDLIAPDTLRELVKVLEAHPGSVARCPWYRFEPVSYGWKVAPASCAPRRPGQDDLAAWLTGWYHPPCSLLWSREAYERSGGWDSAVKVNTDGDIMMRGLIAGNRLVPTQRGTGYYRRLPGDRVSLSNTRRTRQGTESRLFVLDRVAGLLAEQGRIRRYRAALAEAYLTVASGAEADLADRARHEAAVHAGPTRLLAARAAAKLAERRRWIGERAGVSFQAATEPALPGAAEGAEAPRPGPAAREERQYVSVVIPAYNRAHTLPRAIESVLAQDHADLELLVVDDGSTDDTASILAGYDDPRLRVLRQETNRGVSAARNRGMREAQGAFIAFLDSDDEWRPAKLSRQLQIFARGTRGLGLVYTGAETLGLESRRTDTPAFRGDLLDTLLLRNVLHGAGSSAMIKREVVETVGYFDEDLPAIEDYDYWVRLARFFAVDYAPEPLIRYHDPSGDLAADAERRSRNFAANMAARAMFFDRYRHEMQRAGVDHLFLLDTAQRYANDPEGRRTATLSVLAKALLRRPTVSKLYAWLPFAALPRPAQRLVRRGLSAARSRGGAPRGVTAAER